MESFSPDKTDLELLDLLQHDASQSNQELAALVHVSPPTCLRRVKRLHDTGLIERQVAIVQPDRLAALQGHGLACIVEVSLDRQDTEHLDAFEALAVQEPCVQQWWCTRATCRATWRCRNGCSRVPPTCAMCALSLQPTGQNLRQKCL